MEERQQVVDILSGQEVWRLQRQVEPARHADLGVTARDAAVLGDVLLDLHVNLEGVRVEVEHH